MTPSEIYANVMCYDLSLGHQAALIPFRKYMYVPLRTTFRHTGVCEYIFCAFVYGSAEVNYFYLICTKVVGGGGV